MKKKKTTITAELAAGSTASPFFYEVTINHKLCQRTCAEDGALFAPTYAYVSTQNVGTDQYLITLQVTGVIHYTPCGASQCCVKAETISEEFTVPYYSATAPTSVVVAQGATTNNVVTEPCKDCSDEFVSITPITITIA